MLLNAKVLNQRRWTRISYRVLSLTIALSLAVSLGCAKQPPIAPSMNAPLAKPATINLVRPKRTVGLGSQPWRLNVNGSDIGSLPYGSFCSFHFENSVLSFSADAEASADQLAVGIALLLVFLPIGVAAIVHVTADRYEPTNPHVIYVDSDSITFLRLDGAPPFSLVVTDADDWNVLTAELKETSCSDP